MLNVPANDALVSEVLSNSVIAQSLWNDFLNKDAWDESRNEIDQKRWEYASTKMFHTMAILDLGLTNMVNMWAKKPMDQSFGKQINAYNTKEERITEEEYNKLKQQRMENYRNG